MIGNGIFISNFWSNHVKTPNKPVRRKIVGEPRRIETPVTGLNDSALEKLTNAFEFLTEVPLPRVNRRVPHALLVTSMEPGYGKSHLLGRLFRKLEHRATLIYVRPFQDPSSCWRSLLDRLAMELEYPDRADAVACAPGELSQLDVFARHVLAFLLVPLIERGEIKAKDKAKTTTYLSNQPDQAFQNPNLVNWLKKNFQTLLGRLENTLREVGVFHGGRTAWIKILFAYACEPASSHLRNTCLDWIKYQPLEEEEARQIGLKPAELPELDVPYNQRNQKCSERIFDLLKLASFYRPFVLCFDQTELYDNSPDLTKVLGQLIRKLGIDGENVLIAVTANKQVWDDKIFANFEDADISARAVQTAHQRADGEFAQARTLGRAWPSARDPKSRRFRLQVQGKPPYLVCWAGQRKDCARKDETDVIRKPGGRERKIARSGGGTILPDKRGQAQAIQAERSLIKTLQLSEAEILSLAQASLANRT